MSHWDSMTAQERITKFTAAGYPASFAKRWASQKFEELPADVKVIFAAPQQFNANIAWNEASKAQRYRWLVNAGYDDNDETDDYIAEKWDDIPRDAQRDLKEAMSIDGDFAAQDRLKPGGKFSAKFAYYPDTESALENAAVRKAVEAGKASGKTGEALVDWFVEYMKDTSVYNINAVDLARLTEGRGLTHVKIKGRWVENKEEFSAKLGAVSAEQASTRGDKPAEAAASSEEEPVKLNKKQPTSEHLSAKFSTFNEDDHPRDEGSGEFTEGGGGGGGKKDSGKSKKDSGKSKKGKISEKQRQRVADVLGSADDDEFDDYSRLTGASVDQLMDQNLSDEQWEKLYKKIGNFSAKFAAGERIPAPDTPDLSQLSDERLRELLRGNTGSLPDWADERVKRIWKEMGRGEFSATIPTTDGTETKKFGAKFGISQDKAGREWDSWSPDERYDFVELFGWPEGTENKKWAELSATQQKTFWESMADARGRGFRATIPTSDGIETKQFNSAEEAARFLAEHGHLNDQQRALRRIETTGKWSAAGGASITKL